MTAAQVGLSQAMLPGAATPGAPAAHLDAAAWLMATTGQPLLQPGDGCALLCQSYARCAGCDIGVTL
jgi:hypothetical protein